MMRCDYLSSSRTSRKQAARSGIHITSELYASIAKPVGERGNVCATAGLLTGLRHMYNMWIDGFRARVSSETLHGMTVLL